MSNSDRDHTAKISASAISALRAAVGADHVVADPTLIAEYERATFATDQRIPLIILPGSTAQVQAVVRIANQYGLKLYPISRGRNWGLGSRVPVQTGCCVLDLKRMDQILEFDETNAVLTVQPGVSFAQVAAFLRERKSDLYLAATGGPPDSSVLANALERGDGLGPLGDRAKYCNALEVVLPNGDLIHTGLEAFSGSKAGKLAQFGLGPGLEGLFFQSNLGIVTRISVWLTQRPRHFQLLVFAARNEQELIDATNAIRNLQRQGVVSDTAYSLWNVYRFLTAQIKYPWKAFGGRVASPRELLDHLPAAWKGMQWVGFVGIYSPTLMHAVSDRLTVSHAVADKVSRSLFVGPVVARLGRLLARPLRHLTGIDIRKMLDAAYFESAFIGQPTKLETSSIYWRKRGPTAGNGDPNEDRCGLHWICPALPFDGAHIAKVTRTVEKIAVRHGLEPMSMFFNMNQWYMKSFIVIMFDQDVPGEDEAARRCHDELFRTLDADGYSPVRLGIQSMSLGTPSEPEYVSLVRRLKQALDPNDILAPGRYDFRHRWSATVADDRLNGTPEALRVPVLAREAKDVQ